MSTTAIPTSTEPLISMKNIKVTDIHNQCGWKPRRNAVTIDNDYGTIQNQCYGRPPVIRNQCVRKPQKDFITEHIKYNGIHNQRLGSHCTDSAAEANGNSTQQIPQPIGHSTPIPSPPPSYFSSLPQATHPLTGTSASTNPQQRSSNSPVGSHSPLVYRDNAQRMYTRAEKSAWETEEDKDEDMGDGLKSRWKADSTGNGPLRRRL